MRKLFSILLLSLFMVVTTGFTVNAHYCGGKLVDVSVILAPDECCDDDNECCKNEATTIQLEEGAIDLQYIDLDHEFSFEISLFPIAQFELAEQNHDLLFDDLTQLKLLDCSVDLADIQSFRL